jgi:hypothetical protein
MVRSHRLLSLVLVAIGEEACANGLGILPISKFEPFCLKL